MTLATLAFLAAALSFAVQPMLGKWLLPRFGGSPATWSACLAVFQALLLAGYAYAQWLTTRRSFRVQRTTHLWLTLVATLLVLWLSLRPPFAGDLVSTLSPAIVIVLLLLASVGVPFVLLTSTLPLISRWSADAGGNPGWLYAVSNAGSVFGLVGYPFLIEPHWDVRDQLMGWSWAFAGFAVVSLFHLSRRREITSGEAVSAMLPEQTRAWLAGACVPGMLLVATSTHITIDIAATPLFWMLPLGLYLLSFILAFSLWRPSWRGPVLALWAFGAGGIALNGLRQGAASLQAQLGSSLLALFTVALLCHGELALSRPPASKLPRYYLIIALGGALGGACASFVAPLLLSDYYELDLAAVAAFALLLLEAKRTVWSRGARRVLWLAAGVCLPLLIGSLVMRAQRHSEQGRVLEQRRSFFGVLRVVEGAEGRWLVHGRIQHGMQLLDPAQRRTPTMYFGPGTALQRVLQVEHGHRRIGVVGLGVGTVAVYSRPGDVVRFYELDPTVVDFARRHFTFLSDAAGQVEIAVGDGRLLLDAEPPQRFDILVLDAFASDAVPVHLLTREAFAIYSKHLRPNGLLLANTSNRHLDVERVVMASARAVGLHCVVIETPSEPAARTTHVVWTLMARDPAQLDTVLGHLPRAQTQRTEVLWSDQRASVMSIVR